MGTEKRLLLLSHNYPRFDGDFAGVFLQELARQFQRQGVEVHILCPHFEGCPLEETIEGITVHRFRYGADSSETLAYAGNMHEQVKSTEGLIKFAYFLISFTANAIELTRSFKPDLIFAHWLVPGGLTGWLTSRLTATPLSVACHGTDIALTQSSGLMRKLARSILSHATRAFTVSGFLKTKLIEQNLVAANKVDVIPMPARVDLFEQNRIPQPDQPLLLSVARFTRQKQLDVLFRALRKLADKGIEYQCLIYGEGKLKEELQALIDELKLSEYIELRPPVPQTELAPIYARARLTLLPSINEGFGLTLVEAQLSGSAVIGAASGGITDIIADDKTGLLFEPGDSDQLAACIERLLTDDDLHHRLTTDARKQALENFSAEAIADKYLRALWSD